MPRLREVRSVEHYLKQSKHSLIGTTYRNLSIGMEFQVLLASPLQVFKRCLGRTARAELRDQLPGEKILAE